MRKHQRAFDLDLTLHDFESAHLTFGVAGVVVMISA